MGLLRALIGSLREITVAVVNPWPRTMMCALRTQVLLTQSWVNSSDKGVIPKVPSFFLIGWNVGELYSSNILQDVAMVLSKNNIGVHGNYEILWNTMGHIIYVIIYVCVHISIYIYVCTCWSKAICQSALGRFLGAPAVAGAHLAVFELPDPQPVPGHRLGGTRAATAEVEAGTGKLR